MDLLGLQLKKGRPPSLSAIYVPQTTTAARPPRSRRLAVVDGARDRCRHDRPRASTRHTLALSRLATESLYVSGAPGTGKSTFCRWVAWLVAEGAMPSLDVPPPDEFAEVLDDGLKGRLPVLLRLREFWEYLPPRVGASLTVSDLEDAIGRWVDKKRPDGLDSRSASRAPRARLGAAPARRHGRSAGEQHDRRRQVAPRQQLLSALADACPIWSDGGQPAAADEPSLWPLRGAGRAHDARARRRCSRSRASCSRCSRIAGLPCCRAEPQTGAETAADLFANIDSQPWLVELAANPLLLTAMCIVFDEGKRLPQDKHELYERVVATVLYSRYQDPADIDKVKRELGVIAYGMHTGCRARPTAGPRRRPKRPSTKWSGGCRTIRSARTTPSGPRPSAFEAREALLSQSGLFLSTGDERAGFAHLSFQEFFAAQRSVHRGRGAARRRVPASARPRPSGATRCRSCSGGSSACFPSRRRRSTCWKRGSTAPARATRACCWCSPTPRRCSRARASRCGPIAFSVCSACSSRR